ncbi:uncharacterized protein EI97DRAFT_454521 [Westerdykella ornata]|uniref:Transcription factor domain-containing protein n=1 Tax=Westerdykella ornata TaxID=318751 RepID=A0A6A6JYN1_WESOR|nr:uncharacterized protein EI97DRAFT_454521 [Westerdykella ornata]KAF2281315.1 hypothetical protein EI97DRAFT_454521 [Westerdykella ornata]
MESVGNGISSRQMPISPSAPVKQDFLFVDTTKSAKSSRQGRRNARSFVMQKARRERPWSTSKHAAKKKKSNGATSPGTVETPDLSHASITPTPSPPLCKPTTQYFPIVESHRYEVKSEICPECQLFVCWPGHSRCHGCLLLQPPAPLEDIDYRLFDPFGTVSVQMNATVSELLDHFVTEMAPSTIAVDIRRESKLMLRDWFGTALHNTGFMHSLLCTAALHLYIVGRCSMDIITYHKTQAIAAINSAISDPDPNLAISDANIGAVFNLLCVEESLLLPFLAQEAGQEMLNQREIHLNGLRRMVQLRGGLDSIGSNRILQAFILWHSTAHAIASFDAPYLSTINHISRKCLPRHPPGYSPKISSHLMDYCREARVKESLIELVESVLTLIANLNVWFGDANSPLDPLDIQNYSCVLECLLLNWIRENEDCTNPFQDALCVAMLIFTVRVTEALQHRSHPHPLHHVASIRLQKALNATSCFEWAYCQDLLLWILAIGTISAEGSKDYNWFIRQMSAVCDEYDLHSADAVLHRLHLCGWVSFKLDSAVHAMWNKIVNFRQQTSTDLALSDIVGPLQSQVPEPNLADWESIDWAAMGSELHHMPGEGVEHLGGGDPSLSAISVSYTPRDSLYYMALTGGPLNAPVPSLRDLSPWQ